MFLQKLLPADGRYCVAMLLPGGKFRHFFHSFIDDAARHLTALDTAGHTVYIAQASFDPDKIDEAIEHNKANYNGQRMKLRSQANARYLKNFFLDIDCGEKWPLKNQREGAAALRQFVQDTGLPMPAVVNSGNGLYAHWILDKEIPEPQWRTVAFMLKKVVAAYAPAIGGDSSRTSDSASVLRVPGTTNRKPGRPEKPVQLLHDPEPIQFEAFADKLKEAARKAKVQHDALLPPKVNTDINAEFYVHEQVVSDAGLIADKCAQLNLMRSTRGDIIEPIWYACIGVLVHCINGEEICHDWSQGHPQYTQTQTNEKIKQWLDAGLGPTTCAKFGAENPGTCIGCPHNGKIKSPIMLGRPEPVKVDLPEEQCGPPPGFRRSEDGLYAEEEGRWVRFYDCDLYPYCLAYDESLGYEVTTIRHTLPHEGQMECTVRSSLVNDPKAFITTLSDNHIKVVGVKEKKYMVGYIESYQAKLQRQRRMTMLLCQMGWKEARNGSQMFVLGRRIFHKDGSMEDASLARNVPKAAEGYHTKGELAKWTNATSVLGLEGMEPFAFALLAGFGAPLMKYTGFDGALLSMVGDSGVGKTLMLRWIQSIWGYHNDLMMLRDDTKNALVSRLGVYGNLPLTVDEVTNMGGIELSDFVYKVTQGRDKARLTKNAEERALINKWNTLAITSANASMIDKLSETKHDASAEINRVFEYHVKLNPRFEGLTTKQTYWAIHENYGHAGEVFAKWLVRNHEMAALAVEKIREKLDYHTKAQGDERYWSATASVALAAGAIAKSLGLIKFEITPVFDWAVEIIRNMRGDKVEVSGDFVGILGQFLDEHAGNRLLVKGQAGRGKVCTVLEAPRGPLIIRYELDTRKIFFPRAVFKVWLAKRYGSYTQVKKALTLDNILIDSNTQKCLGAGTYYDSAQQPCWAIDLRNPRLGNLGKTLLDAGTMLGEDPVKNQREEKWI